MKLATQLFGEVLDVLRSRCESPGSERRRSSRMLLATGIRAAVCLPGRRARRYSALTRDLSTGGIGLMQHFPADSEAKVLVELPRRHGVVVVVTQVKFTRPLADNIFIAGMEFQKLADDDLVDSVWAESQSDQERISKLILS